MSGGRLELLPRPLGIIGVGRGLLAALVGPRGVEDCVIDDMLDANGGYLGCCCCCCAEFVAGIMGGSSVDGDGDVAGEDDEERESGDSAPIMFLVS